MTVGHFTPVTICTDGWLSILTIPDDVIDRLLFFRGMIPADAPHMSETNTDDLSDVFCLSLSFTNERMMIIFPSGGGSTVLVPRASIEGRRRVEEDTLASEVPAATADDEDVNGTIAIIALTMSIISGIGDSPNISSSAPRTYQESKWASSTDVLSIMLSMQFICVLHLVCSDTHSIPKEKKLLSRANDLQDQNLHLSFPRIFAFNRT
ncbi:hypothetical protein M9H77_02205 [Catharanthus roseus]|uniref:Uncharacterized protein n=1 Tax=Catharanthus roseus TaxID=4058 RepID=A0ACC0C7N3_CATRO|nr:hypothetical protein M9H77_02205 [Catharanthus roseus]